MSHDKILMNKDDLTFMANITLGSILGPLLRKGHCEKEELQVVMKQAHAVVTRLPPGCHCSWAVVQAAPKNASRDFSNTEIRKSVPALTKTPTVPPNLYPKAGKTAKKVYAELLASPGGVTIPQMAEKLGCTYENASGTLTNLVRRKLAQRRKIEKAGPREPKFIYEVVVP